MEEKQFYTKDTLVVNTRTKRRGRVAWRVKISLCDYIPVHVLGKNGQPILREWAKAHVNPL